MADFKILENEPELFLSDPFVYRINPADYISLTGNLIKNPKLFQEIDSAKEKNAADVILEYSSILERWNKLSENELINYFNLICEDFENYKYFYREVGASLKFNPLSQRHSGMHILERMNELLIEYLKLINPKALYAQINFSSDKEGLKLNGQEIYFYSRKLKIFTSHSSAKAEKEISPEEFKTNKLVVYVVTIGPGVDEKVKNLTADGHIFEAYLLNGIGAGAAEMVANDLNLYINDTYGNGTAYKRFSPGYGDWPVTDQAKVFKLLNPEKNIGVKLTDSYIMLPEKSTSGIMGIVDD